MIEMKEKVLYWESKISHAYIRLVIYNRIIEIDTNLWGPRHIYAVEGDNGYALFLDHIEPYYMYIARVNISKGEINVIEIEENYQNLKKIFEMFGGDRNEVERRSERNL